MHRRRRLNNISVNSDTENRRNGFSSARPETVAECERSQISPRHDQTNTLSGVSEGQGPGLDSLRQCREDNLLEGMLSFSP